MLWFILTPLVALIAAFVGGEVKGRRALNESYRAKRVKNQRYDEHGFSSYFRWQDALNRSANEIDDIVVEARWAYGIWWIVIWFFVALALNATFDTIGRIEEPHSRPLVNLGDSSGVSGRFFLGSGYIESKPVYMYYLQDGDSYRLYNVKASNAFITYTDETPQIIFHGSRQGYSNWFSIGADDWRVNEDGYDPDAFEFKVPRGSIKQDFNLDAS